MKIVHFNCIISSRILNNRNLVFSGGILKNIVVKAAGVEPECMISLLVKILRKLE